MTPRMLTGLVALLLTIALAGCGSEDAEEATDAATAPEAASSASAEPSGDPGDDPALQECLAEQGVELPDSGAGGALPDPGSLDPDELAALQEAVAACGDLVPSGVPGGGVDQSALDAFADCMGSRGVRVSATLEAVGQLDVDRPRVARALEVCQDLVDLPAPQPS